MDTIVALLSLYQYSLRVFGISDECVDADADEPFIVAAFGVVADDVFAVSAGDVVGADSDDAFEGA